LPRLDAPWVAAVGFRDSPVPRSRPCRP